MRKMLKKDTTTKVKALQVYLPTYPVVLSGNPLVVFFIGGPKNLVIMPGTRRYSLPEIFYLELQLALLSFFSPIKVKQLN